MTYRIAFGRLPVIAVIMASPLAILVAGAFFDRWGYALSEMTPEAVRWLAALMSLIGNTTLPTIVAAAFWIGLSVQIARTPAPNDGQLRHTRWQMAYLFCSVAGAGLITTVIKHAVGRARPGVAGGFDNLAFHPFAEVDAWWSFPSGHTTGAVATALVLGAVFPRWRWHFIAFAGLAGLSRILLGMHWVSDVFAGATVAYFWTRYVTFIFNRTALG